MKLSIFAKLFLAIFLSMLVTLGAMTASIQWVFRQGFGEYLRKVEETRLEKLAALLEEDYGEQGSWDYLRGNQEYWLTLLRQSIGQTETPAREAPEPEHDHEPPRPPPPRFFGDEPSFFIPPHGHHRPGPHRGDLFRNGHVRVLDTNRQQIIGPPFEIQADAKETLRPITQAGKPVGWLGFVPHKSPLNRLESVFIQQQGQASYAILGLVLIIAFLVALVLARQFLLPVRRLASGAKSLAAGNYDTQVAISSRDELGELGRDFNLLARTLKRNEESRRQWVADTSHELRTPLAVLRSEVEALQDGIREATPDRLRSIHAEVLGMGKLVDDLYQLSLYDLGALNYRMEPLDIIELAEEAVQGFKTRFDGKNIRLSLRCGISNLVISGDSGRLRQLLMNLLENSLRYTDGGGTCLMDIEKSLTSAIINIQDSAPGVTNESLGQLFDRFYRADKSRSRESGGSGLGLSICKNIVEAHGGNIRASHAELGGVWLRIELPLLPS
ncbi:ATP-binding protein [Methylomagnum sp.]